VGDTFNEVISPDGVIEAKHKDDAIFGLGSLTLELPDRELRVGDTWSSDLWLLLDPTATKRTRVRAHHKLDGFQWLAGLKVARIVSTFSKKGEEITVIYKGNPAKIKTDFKGTRYSYFAYQAGRFVGFQDEIEHDYEVDVAQFSSALAGGGMYGASGMPGMPGAPGMPGMPGMPGAPGMPGGPGMPGPGVPAEFARSGAPLPPGMPGAPPPPGGPGAPGFPAVPGMPGAPGMPPAPGMGPEMPGAMPGGWGMQTIPLQIKASGKVVLEVLERQ
jgi:hypothetical protein